MLASCDDPRTEPKLCAAPGIWPGGVSELMVHATTVSQVVITLERGVPIGFAVPSDDESIAVTGASPGEHLSPAEGLVPSASDVALHASDLRLEAQPAQARIYPRPKEQSMAWGIGSCNPCSQVPRSRSGGARRPGPARRLPSLEVVWVATR